jgi:DnaJ like chaperone protein
MSIWGKIIGGAAGFAFGGPIGALLGGIAGHAVDRLAKETEVGDGSKQIAFTIGVIMLGAKMAKADGVVTRDEVQAFREVFQVPPEEIRNVGRIFDIARQDAAGFEPYARQVADLFEDSPEVLEDLMHGLFHIAKADHVIHPAELAYLQGVAEIFGFDEHGFQRIRAHHVAPEASDPYLILGLSHDAGEEEVKRTYRKLSRENHPDRLIAQGLPQEFIDLGNEKMAHINDAYDKIRRQRGWS